MVDGSWQFVIFWAFPIDVCPAVAPLVSCDVGVQSVPVSVMPLVGTGPLAAAAAGGSLSSQYFSVERRRAFMKKFATVDTLRPSCSAIIVCIALFGRGVSQKMASSVRRWMSVKTSRGFLAGCCCCCWRWWWCANVTAPASPGGYSRRLAPATVNALYSPRYHTTIVS